MSSSMNSIPESRIEGFSLHDFNNAKNDLIEAAEKIKGLFDKYTPYPPSQGKLDNAYDLFTLKKSILEVIGKSVPICKGEVEKVLAEIDTIYVEYLAAFGSDDSFSD